MAKVGEAQDGERDSQANRAQRDDGAHNEAIGDDLQNHAATSVSALV